MSKFLKKFERRLLLTDKANYYREQFQTYMTATEWRNVEIAEELAEFLRQGNSLFRFPYFRQIWDLWKISFKSFNAARRHNGFFSVLFSEYMLSNAFITVFTTLELLPKAFISLILYPFLSARNATPMQGLLAEYHARYAAKLQTIPFYDHPYAEERNALNEAYRNCPEKTWVDWFSCTLVSIELWARHWISKPLHAWFHQEGNETAPTTDIIVKYKAKNTLTKEEAKQSFMAALTSQGDAIKATVVNDQVYAKEHKEGKSHTIVYARLRVPRYGDFQEALRNMGEQGIKLRRIAGQKHVQVKCSVDAGDEIQLNNRQQALCVAAGTDQPIYTYIDRIHSNHKICLFDMPVKNLHKKLKQLDRACEDGIQVKFIHNF